METIYVTCTIFLNHFRQWNGGILSLSLSLPREISRLSRRRIMFTRIKISRWLARIPGLDILSHGTFSIVPPPLIASVARSTELLPPTHTRVMDKRRPEIDRSEISAYRREKISLDVNGQIFVDWAIVFPSRSPPFLRWNQTCTNSYEKSPNWTRKILR